MEFLNIQNAAGAKLLPFARSQAQRLRASGVQDVTRNFVVQGFTITVRIHDEVTWIAIRGGSAGYEFFVTEDLREYDAATGSAGWLQYPVEDDNTGNVTVGNFTKGHGVGYDKDGKASPLFSHVFEPPEGVSSWSKVDVPMPEKTSDDTAIRRKPDDFTTRYSWQNQRLAAAYVSYSPGGKSVLTSPNGAGVGIGAYAYTASPRSTALKPVAANRRGRGEWSPLTNNMDEHFDTKSAFYRADGMRVGASQYPGSDKVWYRRCAVQEVELPSGAKRQYVIQTDTHGVFSVWPLDAYQSMGKFPGLYEQGGGFWDVKDYAKRVTPPYPAWVHTVPVGEDATNEQMLWQWNSDGTRCVTTALERVESWVWIWTKSDAPNAENFMALADTCAMRAYSSVFTDAGLNLTQRQDLDSTTAAPRRYADGSLITEDDAVQYLRVREWRHKRPWSTGARVPVAAYEFESGQLLGTTQEDAINTFTASMRKVTWMSVNPANYDPAFTYIPGLLELEIRIVPGTSAETDPSDFDVVFTVLQDRPYSESKRYLIDAAYYIPVPRPGAKAADAADGLARDDLLTAEIECYFTPRRANQGAAKDFGVDVAKDLGGEYFPHYLDPEFAQGGPYIGAPAFVQGQSGALQTVPTRAHHDHIDEPHLESRLTGHFRANGVYAYYTVKKGDQRIQRICVAHNLRWEHGHTDMLRDVMFRGYDQNIIDQSSQEYVWGVPGKTFMPLAPIDEEVGSRISPKRGEYVSGNLMPASFMATIAFADLRYLNFMTLTYQRAQATPSAGLTQSAVYPSLALVKPNRHLHIRGDAVRSVLYTPDVEALGGDPAWNKTEPSETAVLLPSLPRGSQPCGNEGAALAMQQEFAARSIYVDLHHHVAASPKGHWAVCWNCTQRTSLDTGDGPDYSLDDPLPESTAPAWIDVIHMQGGKDSTHREAFNKAFKDVLSSESADPAAHPRGYDYYGDEKKTNDEMAEPGGDDMQLGSFCSQGIFYHFDGG
ncbi:hypothetical protein [Diaphorobacter caeni]|uniref:hypothetical protein n=1 Tax=Diaphorobacter caeni TaxID=2784387 RepID=UPI00188F3C16|nr:hypothetical protein [Diaphorobacter caeni]MBF5006844.1 hypothetical protein [Diaphorobacter caeni]